MNEFERSLEKVLIHEGGYVNHPKDPGGATNKGVIQRTYDSWRTAEGLPKRSVKLITLEEIRAIYRERYWNLIKGNQLPPGVGYVVFDGAVNSGPGQSIKWLQRALAELGLYKGQIDGLIGGGTLEAVRQVNDHDKLIARICDRRLAFLKQLKHWSTFKKGWTSRVAGVKAVGQAWAQGTVGPEITFVPNGDAKAFLTDAKPAPSIAVADASTGGGIGSGGLAVTLQQVQEQLTPLSYGSALIGNVVAGLVIVGAVLTVGGLVYRTYAKKRREERKEALDLDVAQPA